MNRRRFVRTGLSAAALAGVAVHSRPAAAAPKPIKPRRLAAGDTVAIVAPASATFNTLELQIAKESLEALGLKVQVGGHVLDRHGYLAGQDKDRAADINRFFADPGVRAVLPLRGGWGASRVLPWLDFETIRRNPKIVLGYSDITALHMAISAKTGLVTFHGPNGMGRWDEFSVNWVRRVLFDGEAVTLENLREKGDFLVQTENRVQTITPGTARGRILGGNLSIIAAIMGSPYVPDFDGAILFVEDVGEDIYRVDRMLTTLKLAGSLEAQLEAVRRRPDLQVGRAAVGPTTAGSLEAQLEAVRRRPDLQVGRAAVGHGPETTGLLSTALTASRAYMLEMVQEDDVRMSVQPRVND